MAWVGIMDGMVLLFVYFKAVLGALGKAGPDPDPAIGEQFLWVLIPLLGFP